MGKMIAVLIAVIVIVVGFVIALKFDVIPNQQYGEYDGFIICLKSSGAKFYGDYANRESLMQMSFFGDSLYVLEKSGIYVECNKYGPKPKLEKCNEKGIRAYPTWIIDGKKYVGIQGLNKLSEVTGCER